MDHHLGRYRLDRPIGRGAGGEVWLAWDEGPVPRPVAVKRIRTPADGQSAASLRTEAELLATLDHPHLLRVLEVVVDPPGLALVLPLLVGGSVRELLDERGTLSPGEAVALLGPVADAVGSLHARGLVHGDLKPENILLTSDGEPMVADVGLARIAGRPHPGLGVVGTPAYLDPALLEGGSAGPRSDVYALGVMAYEALTGRWPHRGEPAELVALAAAGVHRPLATWPTVPAPLAEVIELALAPDPSVRPADPMALVAALRAAIPAAEVALPAPFRPPLVSGEVGPPAHETMRFGSSSSPPSPSPSALGWSSRWPEGCSWPRALAALAVVAATAAAVAGLAAVG